MKPPTNRGAVSKEALERIRDQGLAPKNVILKAYPGAIFLIDDKAIAFPDQRIASAGARTVHASRRAIVVNCVDGARSATPKSILVVPCSASQKGLLGPWAYELPDDEPGFTAERVVALAHLLQPILKSELRQFLCVLRPKTYLALQAVVARNLGFVDEPRVMGSVPQEQPSAQAPATAEPSSNEGTSDG